MGPQGFPNPPQCLAARDSDTKKRSPQPSTAPRAPTPAGRKWGGGDCSGNPSSPLARVPPRSGLKARSSAAGQCSAGKPLPRQTVRRSQRYALSPPSCPVEIAGKPGEWPPPKSSRAGEGAAGGGLGPVLGAGVAGRRGARGPWRPAVAGAPRASPCPHLGQGLPWHCVTVIFLCSGAASPSVALLLLFRFLH
jgi:hypothetical protein